MFFGYLEIEGCKGGDCLSSFSYRRIILPGGTFLCGRLPPFASLGHRQEHKKGKKGEEVC